MSRRDDDGQANETPVDLAAVQADDALLDMLGGSELGRGGADAELARVLVAWRRDVNSEPIGELVDTDTALATIRAARRPARRRNPVLGPVAAAAAAMVVAFSGIGLLAKYAEPGDQLFGLTKVLYAEYAQSVETAQRVERELVEIDRGLEEGRTSPAQVRESLDRIEQQLKVVNEEQGRTKLVDQRNKLEERLEERLEEMADPPPAAGAPTQPTPQPTPSKAEVAPVPPTSTTASTPPDPSAQTDPTVPSTSPSPSGEPEPGAPGEPEPETPAPATSAEPAPRLSPPQDGTPPGSTPPAPAPGG